MFVTADFQYVTLDQCHFQTRVASDLCRFRLILLPSFLSFLTYNVSDITLICRIRLMSLQKFRHLPLPTFARCSGEDFTYLKIAKCLGKRMKMVMWVFCRELLHAKNSFKNTKGKLSKFSILTQVWTMFSRAEKCTAVRSAVKFNKLAPGSPIVGIFASCKMPALASEFAHFASVQK